MRSRIKDEAAYDRQIKRIYQNMMDACQKEIDSFYGRYANAEGITIAEAKKRIAKHDVAAFERKAARYVDERDFSKRANEELRLYNATMRINRLEMLKANIGLELIAGHAELEEFMGGILKGRTEDELTRQAGILGKTIKSNAQTANAIVNASFHNAKFSDRVWMYQDMLRDDLDKLLQQGLIQGKNPRVLAREIKQKFQTSTYNAERLMRTELARVQTEAQKQSFERNGFDMYEFIVNGGCCPICEGLKGKHFKVAKMMPGENAPPMHPHCRCSTAAWEDSEEYNAWLSYLEQGGTTEEWKKMKKPNEKRATQVEKAQEEAKKTVQAAEYMFGDLPVDAAASYRKTFEKLSDMYPLTKHPISAVGDVFEIRGWSRRLITDDVLREDVIYDKLGQMFGAQFMPQGLNVLRNRGAFIEIGDDERVVMTLQKSFAEMHKHRAKTGKPKTIADCFYDAAYGTEAVMTHEYGHAIANDRGFYKSQQDGQWLRDIYAKYDSLEIAKQVSRYAATSPDEFFAECFVASFDPENDSEIVSEVMKEFRKREKQNR